MNLQIYGIVTKRSGDVEDTFHIEYIDTMQPNGDISIHFQHDTTGRAQCYTDQLECRKHLLKYEEINMPALN